MLLSNGMHLLRTRFAEDIVCEFLPPKKQSNKVIIFCGGMPTLPGNKRAHLLASKKGYWSFFPRYRGTWESGGQFLQEEPTKDILDVIDGIQRSFVSLWDGEEHNINNPEIVVIGSSFGGPAAMLLSKDKRVKKVVCISPAVDWRVEGEDEPLDWLGDTVKKAFGQGYRFDDSNWKKLSDGTFYNPAGQKENIDGSKVMIMHAKDDTIAPPEPVEEFARDVGCKLIMMKKGGHLGVRSIFSWRIFRRIYKFINS